MTFPFQMTHLAFRLIISTYKHLQSVYCLCDCDLIQMNLKTGLSYNTVCITNDFPLHSNDSPHFNSIYSFCNKKRFLEFGCQVWCSTNSGCSNSRFHAALMFTDFVTLFQQFVFDSDLISQTRSMLCWSEGGPAPTRKLL